MSLILVMLGVLLLVIAFIIWQAPKGIIPIEGHEEMPPTAEADFFARRKAFIDQMDDRQKIIHASLKGSSDAELFLTLEKRIFELESRVLPLAPTKVSTRSVKK